MSVLFALLFTYVQRKSGLSGDTVIGVFSSTAVAFGIFISTLGGGSFTKFNSYLIGDILSVTPPEIGLLFLVLVVVAGLWYLTSDRLFLSVLHPNLASSRGVQVGLVQGVFTVVIAVVVTMAPFVGGPAGDQQPVGAAGSRRPELCEKSASISPVLGAGGAGLWNFRSYDLILLGLLCGRRHFAAAGDLFLRRIFAAADGALSSGGDSLTPRGNDYALCIQR